MRWKISLGEKTHVVELPDQTSPGDWTGIKIDGKAMEAKFLGSDFIQVRASQTAAPAALRLRSAVDKPADDDGAFKWSLEWSYLKAGKPVITDVSAQRLFPGDENKAPKKRVKDGRIKSQITGKVVKVLKTKDTQVQEGEELLIIEAMKMENKVLAPISGVITELAVKEGDSVAAGAALLTIKAPS